MSPATRPAQDERVFTVSELTLELRITVEEGFPALWVEGEVSNFVHHSSGHMYFSLKDKKAQLPAVFFKSRAPPSPRGARRRIRRPWRRRRR